MTSHKSQAGIVHLLLILIVAVAAAGAIYFIKHPQTATNFAKALRNPFKTRHIGQLEFTPNQGEAASTINFSVVSIKLSPLPTSSATTVYKAWKPYYATVRVRKSGTTTGTMGGTVTLYYAGSTISTQKTGTMTSGTYIDLVFEWRAQISGTYPMKAVIIPNTTITETSTTDNELKTAVDVQKYWAVTTEDCTNMYSLQIKPTTDTTGLYETFCVLK